MALKAALIRTQEIVWGRRPETQEERRLLRKIDWFVLSFTCLNYWSNYLNRTNFQNAYVSGMREDLGFVGDQYNVALTVFTIGYIVGLIPNNLALQYVPARIWLPAMGCIWGVLSACVSKTTTVGQLYAIRFLTALAESSTFSGTHYILGCWYKEHELGKRSAVFAASAQMGSLFSGIMQGAIHSNMDGAHGLAGWRWLFVIDGILAIAIAAYGFVFFPDVPQKTKAWYLSDTERKMAVARLPLRPETRMGWDLVGRCLKSWQWYAFTVLFAITSMLEAPGFVGVFALWLKAEGYPVARINYYALGLVTVAIATTLAAAWWTDWLSERRVPVTSSESATTVSLPADLARAPTTTPAALPPYRPSVRWPVNYLMALCALFSGIVLAIYDGVPRWLIFAAYCISGAGYAGQATNFAWCNVACAHDEQLRAVTLASMNVGSNVLAAWWGLVFYPATDAPKFRRGMVTLVVMAVLTTIVGAGVQWLDAREARRRARWAEAVETSEEDIPSEQQGRDSEESAEKR
ncbi:major facilitator superfamily domain-containing protein [Schizophyllum amplum]|uniref:Major facilitator superfamily domain-containing protein n=1 Tax=Schizophyllum amplum TaxID=97359 RepID=A0A550CQC9_9AGAR|nr:major facilitator superfamily domain-containing protein [Auriculariopsis ampla]